MPNTAVYTPLLPEKNIQIYALPETPSQPLISPEAVKVYGSILKKYCNNCIDDDIWKIPYREGLQSYSISFENLDVSEDELLFIKAYIIDTLSHHSSPSTCVHRVKSLAFLFKFLHQQDFSIKALSSPIIRMYRLWLDQQAGLSNKKKNDLEAFLKSLVPFLHQHHLLRPGQIVVPKPRPTPQSKLVRAPEEHIMCKLDQFFFNWDNPVPCDYRCAYLLARMIPARDAEIFSLPIDCFRFHDSLITIRIPTFKETPNHTAVYQEHHRLTQPFPENILVQALQEQQAFAQAHQADISSPAFKARLMVSSNNPRRLIHAAEFNLYLQNICAELNITDHSGAPAHVTMYSLRHSIGAAMSSDPDIPNDEFTRAFSHTNQASDQGYGHSSQYDELQKTAATTQMVLAQLTPNSSVPLNRSQTVLPGKLVQMQRDPQSWLIGLQSVCQQRNCVPQLASCIHCDSFIPDPRFIPAAKECCNILTKRIELCQTSGNQELMAFSENQLSIYQTFISRAQKI